MNIAALREKRAAKLDALKAITTAAENDNSRDLTDTETRAFDAGRAEVEKLDREIRNAEFLAEAERRADAAPVSGPDGAGPDLTAYSLAKALQGALNGQLSGVEAEAHQELSRGRQARGIMVPTSVLMETRVLKTTTPVAGPGGNLIGREVLPVADRPRPALLVESMGATVMRDLVGNVDIPVLAESGTASWVAEHNPVTRSDPKFAKASLSPKTVGAEYEVSRRMVLQTANAIEEILRRDLSYLLRQALDRAAVTGAGGVEPTGILNTTGINSVTALTDLSDTTAEMINALDLDDVTGTRAFLTNPNVAMLARKTKDGEGRPIPLADLFHGERVEFTRQVPADYGDPDTDALIYGQWSELVIGYWSAVDILVNPYHSDVASRGGVLIHAFLDADVAVRTPQAFAVTGIA